MLTTVVKGKTYRDPVRNSQLSLHELLSAGHYFVGVSVITSFKIKFTHSSNDTEHYRKQLFHPTCTKHGCASAVCIFNWNTLVAGH